MVCLFLPALACSSLRLSRARVVVCIRHHPGRRCPRRSRLDVHRPGAPSVGAAWPADRPRTTYEQARCHRRLLGLEESSLPRRHLSSGRDCVGIQSPLVIGSSPPGLRRLPLSSHSAGREIPGSRIRHRVHQVRGLSSPMAWPCATPMRNQDMKARVQNGYGSPGVLAPKEVAEPAIKVIITAA